jgi:hypothetical protein
MSQLILNLTEDLATRLAKESEILGISSQMHAIEILDNAIAPIEALSADVSRQGIEKLRAFLQRIPSVKVVSISGEAEFLWWVKLRIDITSKLTWNTVQELSSVLNYISIEERLPTLFMPVSPPPYLNGGPADFLSWIIQAQHPFVDAGYVADVLRGRLPSPVEDEQQWLLGDGS